MSRLVRLPLFAGLFVLVLLMAGVAGSNPQAPAKEGQPQEPIALIGLSDGSSTPLYVCSVDGEGEGDGESDEIPPLRCKYTITNLVLDPNCLGCPVQNGQDVCLNECDDNTDCTTSIPSGSLECLVGGQCHFDIEFLGCSNCLPGQ